MNAAVNEFPPIALYAVLSLAVAVLSLVAAFHREAVTANGLLETWRHLLDASAYLSLFAWVHLEGYLLWKFLDAPSVGDKFNQLVHFVSLFSFGYIFYYTWRFWTGKEAGAQNITPRQR